MQIDEGAWIDFKSYRLWIHGIKEMTKAEVIKEANEILKSGWMHRNNWLSDAIIKKD